MSKKKPNVQASLFVLGLTNADVAAFDDGGYVPVIRWVSKKTMWNEKHALLFTHQVRERVAKRDPKQG